MKKKTGLNYDIFNLVLYGVHRHGTALQVSYHISLYNQKNMKRCNWTGVTTFLTLENNRSDSSALSILKFFHKHLIIHVSMVRQFSRKVNSPQSQLHAWFTMSVKV